MSQSVEKLALLRAAMKQNGIDAYLICSSDPHIGEYLPDHWKIIQWLTGFSGSAATVVITDSFAGLWTDSRYTIQAAAELTGSGTELIKSPSGSGYYEWLADNMTAGTILGTDGNILSLEHFRILERRLSEKKIEINVESDLISDIWADRPAMPESQVWDYPVEYAGRDRIAKMSQVRSEMKKAGVNYILLTSPEDIMWLLNIRGNDLPYIPLVFCFALFGEEQLLLFANEDIFPRMLSSEFDRLGIVILPYEEIQGMLPSFSEGTIQLSPGKTSVSIFRSIPPSVKIKEVEPVPARLKCIRNKTEIENIEKVMISDGVALTRFFHWIDVDLGIVPMSERSLVMRLHEFRLQQKGYLGPSFATIVAFNDHSALPHYSPTTGSDVSIGDKGILLVDSGGQYLGGTTDITRTIAIGTPTAQQKKDFTLVLKGMISLSNIKFPYGTKGYQIDMTARKSLWENGLNFGHGTGHGVGSCLSVHEGPQSISPVANNTVIDPGMVLSDEPGVYREGEYGIRTENLILCYEDEENEFGRFLKFDTLSLCFIDQSLIEKSLLDSREIAWLNEYHSEVYNKISPRLNEEERAWLIEKTSSI
jgi:Xaa-Pro aminopeptidase